MTPTRFVAFLLCLAFLALSITFREAEVDDSYIAYRYSDNLAQGHGLVWNVGEDPVEGFTSFLWVILHAGGLAVGIEPLLLSRVLSVLSAFGIIVLLCLSTVPRSLWLALPLAGALATSPALAYLSMQGLETTTTALLLLAVAWLTVRVSEDPTKSRIWGWHASVFVAGLSRPDTLPFTAPLALALVLRLFLADRRRTLSFLMVSTAFIVAGVAYLAWKNAYFGHFLPNTYFVKLQNERGLVKIHAAPYLRSFLFEVLWPHLLVTLAVLPILSRRRLAHTFPILLGSLSFTAYLFTITPIQGFLWRFIMPAFPALLFALSESIETDEPRLGHRVRRAALALATIAVLVLNARLVPVGHHEEVARTVKDRAAVGKALAGLEGRLFTSASGAIPYYSRWTAVDRLGLNSEAIAQSGLTPEVLERLRPDLIVIRSTPEGVYPRNPLRHRIANRYMIDHGFVAVATIHRSLGYYIFYFARPDSPLFDEICERLTSISEVEYGSLTDRMLETRIERLEAPGA